MKTILRFRVFIKTLKPFFYNLLLLKWYMYYFISDSKKTLQIWGINLEYEKYTECTQSAFHLLPEVKRPSGTVG